jgi:hypothetical protein
VAHQKIIRNIAATLEALVGMGCGEMLRRGGFFGGAGARMQSDGQNTEPFESLVKLVSNIYGNPAMIQKLTLAVIYLRLPTVSARPFTAKQ